MNTQPMLLITEGMERGEQWFARTAPGEHGDLVLQLDTTRGETRWGAQVNIGIANLRYMPPEALEGYFDEQWLKLQHKILVAIDG